jgi:serine/threonine protein kinase
VEDPSAPCPHCGFDLAENQQKFPVALRAGTVLNDRYIVGRVLGQGGFGITYVAFDTQLQARVAIKEYMPSDMATRVEGTTVSVMMDTRAEDFTYGAERFQEEARTLAKFIGHPNIAGVSSYFDQNDTSYFVMDYIEGVSFKSYIANNGGKVSVDETLNVMIPVLRALTAVHAEGFIHRDVTPDNIYISKDGNVKLLDFGSARYSIGDKSKSLDVILKVGYAPKEQYIRRGRQGPYTDVYSCAACFYAALTGYLPPESLERLDQDTLVPVSQVLPEVPEWLDKAILKGLAVQPEDRFQSAAEFLDAIENQLVVDVPAAGQTAPAQPAKKKVNPLMLGGIAAAIVVVLGLGMILGGQGGDGRVPGMSGESRQENTSLKKAEVPYITIQGQEYSTNERSLELQNMGLTDSDIQDLKYMVNLTYLSLDGNDITDISPISGLTGLRNLNVMNNPNLTDLSPVSGLTNLEQINFYGSPVADYSFMAGLTNLVSIQLYDLQEGTDLSFLSNLTKVQSLYTSGGNNSGINDLSFLSGMTGLQELGLEVGYDIDTIDLAPLAGLTKLTRLQIYHSGGSNEGVVKDLTPLAGLTNLQELNLTVEVESLSPLANLTELRSLYLHERNGGNSLYLLTDISAVANMTKLTTLSLTLGEQADVSPLSGLTELVEISLSGNFEISDFQFMSGMTKLRNAHINPRGDMQADGIQSFKGLENLTGLRELIIYGCGSESLRDTTPLSGLTNLTKLSLPSRYSNDGVYDLSGISGLTKLQELRVYGKVTSLEPLQNLTELRTLDLSSVADWDHPLQSLAVFSGLENLRSLTIGCVAEGVDTSPVSQVTNLNIY